VQNSTAEIQGVLLEIDLDGGSAVKIERIRQLSTV